VFELGYRQEGGNKHLKILNAEKKLESIFSCEEGSSMRGVAGGYRGKSIRVKKRKEEGALCGRNKEGHVTE